MSTKILQERWSCNRCGAEGWWTPSTHIGPLPWKSHDSRGGRRCVEPEEIFSWHVVSNEIGTILSVWGSALLADAQRSAKAIQSKTGCLTYLHMIKGDRPHVGQTISMRGVSTPIED